MKDAAVSIHRRVLCLCIFQPLPELFIFTIRKLDLQPDVHLVFIKITCNKNACKPFSRLLVGMKNGSNIFSVIIPPRMPHFSSAKPFLHSAFYFIRFLPKKYRTTSTKDVGIVRIEASETRKSNKKVPNCGFHSACISSLRFHCAMRKIS